MKCEVVRDLIPLYDEKLCSAESAALVEEHIKTCAACKGLLEALPKTELPKADTNELKPFVKVKRKLRARIIGLITLGVVLLAVLIPVGYLTVNQIFHINGGTDFEDLIYKHELRQFAEMIAEGRMEEYAQRLSNVKIYDAPDGDSITYRSFYFEELKSAYENVKKYDPRIGKISCDYSNYGGVTRWLDFTLEFTRADGSVYPIKIYNTSDDGKNHRVTVWNDPRFLILLPELNGERSDHEVYSAFSEDDIPTDLREIYAFLNTLYLADGGELDIKMIEKFLNKPTADPMREESIEIIGFLIAIDFAPSDYNKIYDGLAAFMRSNYLLESAVGSTRFDAERNMFYYPVMLIGSDGEQQAAASIKLYIDEYGFHSPRPEDIRGITGDSDLEIKLAGIFG